MDTNKSAYTGTIRKFIKKKNIPLWYKELSEQQMKNADELLNNLRDDTQQETTHRTKLNLQLLGICPVPRTAQIKIAIELSQGNDLAFLWFLLELYYSKGLNQIGIINESYDFNQQIIMSVIVHLDMCPTLRELDRLLPKRNIKKKSPSHNVFPSTNKINYCLPYLEPLPLPVSHKKICTKVKEFQPNFYPYAMYTDPNYINPNETNRWYTDPALAKVLDDTICESVNEYNENINNKGMIQSMCAQPDDIETIKMAIKNKCNEFLESNRSEKQRNKFIQQIENYLKNVKNRFSNMSEGFEILVWSQQLINQLLNQTIDMNGASLCNEILSYAINAELFEENNKIIKKGAFDYGYNRIKTIERYFKAPSKLPFVFDLGRIFDCTNLDKEKSVSRMEYIKQKCNDPEISESKLKQIRKYNLSLHKNNESINDWETCLNLNQLKTNLLNKKIDPNNKELMNDLLIGCIKEMKKNPRFVMIQLPEVHKLQVLQLWIRMRFGYVITQRRKQHALKISKQIIDEMRRFKMKIPLPKNHFICSSNYFSFSHKNIATRKAKTLLNSYFNNLKARLLDDTRMYWYCMESGHCNSASLRRIFYSYLPSKPQDVFPFRPWQCDDYMDAKSAYIKKLAKTMKNSNC